MKQLNRFFSILILASLLASCGPVYKRHYEFVPPKSDVARMCTAQCIQSKNTCEQTCRMGNEACAGREHNKAMDAFEAYKEVRYNEGKPVEKKLSDFDHSAYCFTDCSCESTYRSCYTTCGGKINEKLKCVAFCDKAKN